jgi:hypothetical protein
MRGVDYFTYHLIGEHKHCLEGKFALAVIEQIFKTGAQEVNDHHVVVTFDSKPVNIWDAD